MACLRIVLVLGSLCKLLALAKVAKCIKNEIDDWLFKKCRDFLLWYISSLETSYILETPAITGGSITLDIM